ncbi:uncharacterized protein LOC116613549 isoform X3 [Nematostella vectensis]|uniref:uncharacterized protein LOC116613549 isoform X3 n=1 Tax=Nematostella vectensis TaxID=45351 RepID=UPI00207715D0|nr:uncharacterized protein LOC116613549 isoform X3 [Nematostella vectensis]
MANYDYNKGYRGFRFTKNTNIDKQKTALSSYCSMREKQTLLWISNTEKVIAKTGQTALKTSASTQMDDTSVMYFPSISSKTPTRFSSTPGRSPDDPRQDFVLLPTSSYALPTTPATLKHSEAKRRQGKIGYQASRDAKTGIRDRQLQECLVIHNGKEMGSERSTALLSKEKAEDIRVWGGRYQSAC